MLKNYSEGAAITHPQVLYRYSQNQDKHDFDALFGDVFSIVFCDSNELALHAMQQQRFDAVFIEFSGLEEVLNSPVLEAAKQAQEQKILLNADVSLDGVIQLLDSHSLDKCFAKPYDVNLIKSIVFAATMQIQEPLRSGLASSEGAPRVLIVDDEVHATKYLKKNLQILGAPFDILCAANAEQALELLAAQSVAVIISDHKMPGMQGNQLLNTIRNIQPNVVRILTSAYGEVDVALNAINEGSIFQYIKKPWDAEQVLACINQALQKHQWLQEQSQRSQREMKQQYQQIVDARIKNISASFTDSIDGLAGQGTLLKFLDCLREIRLSSSYTAAVMASNTVLLESQLLAALHNAISPKLDQLSQLIKEQPDSNYRKNFIAHWLQQDSQQPLNRFLFDEVKQAFSTLMSASGIAPLTLQVDASPTSINISLPGELKIYSHLLGPIKKISDRFIQQQTALLMLFVVAGVLQGELILEGGKQSLGLSLTCVTKGRG